MKERTVNLDMPAKIFFKNGEVKYTVFQTNKS